MRSVTMLKCPSVQGREVGNELLPVAGAWDADEHCRAMDKTGGILQPLVEGGAVPRQMCVLQCWRIPEALHATARTAKNAGKRRSHLFLAAAGSVTRGALHGEDMLSRDLVFGCQRKSRDQDESWNASTQAGETSDFRSPRLGFDHAARPIRPIIGTRSLVHVVRLPFSIRHR